jgi:hypothetical protein
MPAKKTAKVQNKFALRLMPSVRLGAEKISASEGVSLNQFINVAIAEKVARVEHDRWAANRQPVDDAARADALDLLRRGGKLVPEPGDELPAEYSAWRRRKGAARASKSS